MLVQCPSCTTTYRVSDDIVKGAAPAFRCSRCGHMFESETASSRPAAPRSKGKDAPESPAGEELCFDFTPAAPADMQQGPKDVDPAASSARERTAAAHAPPIEGVLPASPPPPDQKTAAAVSPDPPAPTAKEIAKLDERISSADAFFSSLGEESNRESAGQILPLASHAERRASIFPYLTLLALLVIGFSFFAAATYAHPSFAQRLLGPIPVLGGLLMKNNHLKNGIVIRSLGTNYQTIQGDREVLVITGIAVNQNPVVIREARITGKVYDQRGKELEQQTIWLGNTISPKIIRGMTAEDIPHLQNLKPLKSFEIPPGDSISFTIVFLRAAKNAAEFTCNVDAAAV